MADACYILVESRSNGQGTKHTKDQIDTRGYQEYNNKCRENSEVSQLDVGNRPNVYDRPNWINIYRPKIMKTRIQNKNNTDSPNGTDHTGIKSKNSTDEQNGTKS